MLTALAKMNHSLVALGHAGLQVNCNDDYTVTTANHGRQLFAEAELGLPKAVALINRNNRFFGTNWKAIPERFCTANLKVLPNHGKATVYISCVDTVSARLDIASVLERFADPSHLEHNKYYTGWTPEMPDIQDRSFFLLLATFQNPIPIGTGRYLIFL